MLLEYLLLTYKNPTMLKRAIKSVIDESWLWSTYDHTVPHYLRLTILDDCEVEAIEEFGAAKTIQYQPLNNCQIICSRNTMKEKAGRMKSRMGKILNQAVYSSNSDLVMMLCDDDAIIPGASLKVLEWFEAHPEEQWAYGTCIGFDASAEGDFPNLPTYGEVKPLVPHRPQEQETIPERTCAANVLGVQSVVWRRDAQVANNIRWLDESHPQKQPIDHQVFQHMDSKFVLECPFIGFPIQYKGIHPGQVSRW